MTDTPLDVTLRLTRVDAGNLDAMLHAGYRKLRDDTVPEATAAGLKVLRLVLDAIQPILQTTDADPEATAAADFRAGSHALVTIWCDPDRGDKTGTLAAMAESPVTACVIVDALNRVLSPGSLTGRIALVDDVLVYRDGRPMATATSPEWAQAIYAVLLAAGCTETGEAGGRR